MRHFEVPSQKHQCSCKIGRALHCVVQFDWIVIRWNHTECTEFDANDFHTLLAFTDVSKSFMNIRILVLFSLFTTFFLKRCHSCDELLYPNIPSNTVKSCIVTDLQLNDTLRQNHFILCIWSDLLFEFKLFTFSAWIYHLEGLVSTRAVDYLNPVGYTLNCSTGLLVSPPKPQWRIIPITYKHLRLCD